jgi:choline dehydrogenase-like flavoprotein
MIVDARHLPEDETLSADLCIVGGGPAGITLAVELLGSGLSVILAEAGGEVSEPDLTPVFGGEVFTTRHPPIELYRSRCLGGTSSLWGGRCAPFDRVDFEPRDWVPHSGWPISLDDLDPHYRRAAQLLDIGRFSWTAAEAIGGGGRMIPGFEDDALLTDTIDRFSPPVDFGKRYRSDLAASGNLRVLLNANCLKIGLDSGGGRVETLEMASVPGRRFTIRPQATVLAAGGLETPRLLLLSDVGNRHGLVGRFYGCHLQGKTGILKLDKRLTGVIHHYEKDADGVYCRRKLRISEDEQRRRKLLNLVVRLEHPAIPDPAHGSGILSAMYLSRHFLKKEYARRLASTGLNGEANAPGAAVLLRHAGNLVADAPALLRFAAHWFPNRRFAYRRLPYVTLPNKDNRFHLDYYAEQAPNPDSRVMLGDTVDRFGRRRLKVDWRTSAIDHDSLAASYLLMKERLQRSGLGDLMFNEDHLRTAFEAIGGHHIGTTRMAGHPSRGVVDAAGKVFGTDNLFIASAATFPTTGYASPTFTIVALAVRLAAHLKQQQLGR